MNYVDEFKDSECGCRSQKGIYYNSQGRLRYAWIVRQQCPEHKEESEEIRRWFSEGGEGGKDVLD